MEDALRGLPANPVVATGHTRANPERIFTERNDILQQYPNTFDVVVHMGEQRGDTMPQLHMRLAGASLARTLQARD